MHAADRRREKLRVRTLHGRVGVSLASVALTTATAKWSWNIISVSNIIIIDVNSSSCNNNNNNNISGFSQAISQRCNSNGVTKSKSNDNNNNKYNNNSNNNNNNNYAIIRLLCCIFTSQTEVHTFPPLSVRALRDFILPAFLLLLFYFSIPVLTGFFFLSFLNFSIALIVVTSISFMAYDLIVSWLEAQQQHISSNNNNNSNKRCLNTQPTGSQAAKQQNQHSTNQIASQ